MGVWQNIKNAARTDELCAITGSRYSGSALDLARNGSMRMGYNYVVPSVRADHDAASPGFIGVTLTLQNIGVAPFYYGLNVALACNGDGDAQVRRLYIYILFLSPEVPHLKSHFCVMREFQPSGRVFLTNESLGGAPVYRSHFANLLLLLLLIGVSGY